MSFTQGSEKLIKTFIKEFEKYCVKKTKTVQKRTDNILKTIFQDIRLADNFEKYRNALMIERMKQLYPERNWEGVTLVKCY